MYIFDMKIIVSKLRHPGSSYSMYYIDEFACTTKTTLVTCQTGYAGKSLLKLSYDNSFFFKERSSAVGRGDGLV